MFALQDLDCAYVSFERVFDRTLRGKPVIVASANDACAIARSSEAKALGVKMGQPIHEIPPAVRKQLIIRSANFELYGSMSNRVYATLLQMVPEVERYSVDECFLGLSGIRDRVGFAHELRDTILRFCGIPSGIGISGTKTLAKAANRLAKRGAGVVDLSDPRTHADALASLDVGDVWGVGRKWAARLQERRIMTALDLRDAPADMIMEQFGVVLARTQRELRNMPCAGLEPEDPDRKQIIVSRSFGERVTDHQQVHDAIATFAARACEKAREGGLVAGAIQVFAGSDVFRPELRQHNPSCTYRLPRATADTGLMLSIIRRLTEGMLRDGIAYKRAGVMLMDLARPQDIQGDLFNAPVIGDSTLMDTLDTINRKFGRNTLGYASTGWQKNAAWKMKRRMLSPCYTTRLEDLPTVQC